MLLLDTSFLIEFETEVAVRRAGPARGLLQSRPGEPVAISIISLGEFAEGFESARETEAFLTPFRILQLSRIIAFRAARLQTGLAQRLGENDAWIAATALAYDAELIGRERSFSRVPRLKYTAF
jgi:predicted nucleic acid-binding protein